jgi:hypothetical protein
MTTQPTPQPRFVFPPWTNVLPPLSLVAAVGGLCTVIFGIWYYFSPKHTDVGYEPEQPVPYSHKLHAGELGLDCRYCHVNVERSTVASVPPTQVCMNCHATVKTRSPQLNAVRQSWTDGKPVQWLRVHKVADYVYFDHSRHVSRGVGCVECHGRIDEMVTVRQAKPLSMGWCLECHRDPGPHLRPVDKITTMDWEPPRSNPEQSLEDARAEFGGQIVQREKIAPPTACSRCHR